jgi:hypothetical protein
MTWVEEGPGPLSLNAPGLSRAAGAIQAVVTDPVNAERVFVATVGGGIWRSTNAASAAVPNWTPLTDFQPSLSMSAIAMSPLNPNVLYAGCGRTSHADPIFGPNGGPLLGILRTGDGGSSWLELARGTFQGLTVTKLLPLSQVTSTGQVVLAGTWGGGLLRSDDDGQTWNKVGAIPDFVTDAVVNPNNPAHLYVAGPNGISRSDDGGNVAWTDVSAGLGILPPWAMIKLSISPAIFRRNLSDYALHLVYAVITTWNRGVGLFISADSGANWTSMGVPPDGSMPVSPICASPNRPDVVFCASDSGKHWMVTAGQGQSAALWDQTDFQGAGGTAPHTDGRDCAFSADSSIMFETNDGGIYRLINPHGLANLPARHWEDAVGDIRIAEFHSIAYDSVNHILFGATQDNSIPQQTVPHKIAWGANEDSWGDGFAVGVDTSSAKGSSIHYSSQQSLFHFRRRTYTGPTQISSDVGIPAIIDGTGGLGYNVVEGALTPNNPNDLGTIRWNQTWAVNAVNGARLLLGTNFLYESFDRGDHFTCLGGLSKNVNGEWIPSGAVGQVTAYAYGHVNNPDVIYVGAGGRLLLRATASGLPTAIGAQNAGDFGTYPGSSPVGICLNRDDWRRAYVLDDQGRVWRTTDAGATTAGWADLTGNLRSLTGDVRAIAALIPPRFWAGPEALFIGGYGGVYVTVNPGNGPAIWSPMGAGFPNAIVTDLHYNVADDVLIAGTLGRSAWSFRNVMKMFEVVIPNEGIINFLIGNLADGPLFRVTPHGIVPVPPRGPEDLFREEFDRETRRASDMVAQGLRRLQGLNREYEAHSKANEVRYDVLGGQRIGVTPYRQPRIDDSEEG